MGPDRDAGVVPTQLHQAVGGNGAGERLETGAPAAIPTDGDPPTLPLPPVPSGRGQRASRSRDREPRRRERRSRRRRARPNRGLKRAIWATTVALILAVGALVATDLHLLDIHSATAASGDRHESSTTVVRATLKPVNVGGYNAAYEVTAPSFSVTVSTDRPTWVQAQSRATTTFAAELPAGATKQFQATGPLSLEIGAGGSTLVVHAGGEVIGTLRPTLAPWQATFTPT